MTKISPETRATLGSRTRLVHAGREPFEQHGFINTPIYRGSTVLSETVEAFEGRRNRYIYGTLGTPTTNALETAWTELAGAAGTVLTPSGLAAVTIALLSVLKAGDELLVTDSAYAPTRRFSDQVLARFGVTTRYYDPKIGEGIADLFTTKTRAVVVEAPGSQSFEMQDIPGDRSGRACPRHLRRDGQHLGNAAVLSAARPRRGYRD